MGEWKIILVGGLRHQLKQPWENGANSIIITMLMISILMRSTKEHSKLQLPFLLKSRLIQMWANELDSLPDEEN